MEGVQYSIGKNVTCWPQNINPKCSSQTQTNFKSFVYLLSDSMTKQLWVFFYITAILMSIGTGYHTNIAMSDVRPASCLMRLLCTQLLLVLRHSTLLFCQYHCYDIRAANLNPHMIHRSLRNKILKMMKGIGADHPASHYGLLDFHPEDDKTAYFGKIHQNKQQ